jgi:hypothetical protein
MNRRCHRHGTATGLLAGWVMIATSLATTTLFATEPANPVQEQAALDVKIDRLLRLTQSAELVVEDILHNIDLSPLSAEDKALYRQFATPETLRQSLVPVYRQLLTPEEIDAWIRFYETAEGKAIAAKQATLFRASKEVFLEWGSQIAVRAQNEKARRAVETPPSQP